MHGLELFYVFDVMDHCEIVRFDVEFTIVALYSHASFSLTGDILGRN